MTLAILLYLWGSVASGLALIFSFSFAGISVYDLCEDEDIHPKYAAMAVLSSMLLWPVAWVCLFLYLRNK